jgi:hypothetical protein
MWHDNPAPARFVLDTNNQVMASIGYAGRTGLNFELRASQGEGNLVVYEAPDGRVFAQLTGQLELWGEPASENNMTFNPDGTIVTPVFATSPNGTFEIGVGGRTPGYLLINGADGFATIRFDGLEGSATARSMQLDGVLDLGHNDVRGFITLRNADGDVTFAFDGGTGQAIITDRLDVERYFVVGREGQAGLLHVVNNRGVARCELDGENGQIHTVNRDCAELFDVADGIDVEPGTVMVIDHDRTVRPSEAAYDKRVAGAVSGAGATQPGLLLGTKEERSVPIALAGTVTVKMTADTRPVEIGDLIVSSSFAGHAMSAEDPSRSFGAVIGKSLGSLRTGQGLVPILVSLQ